MENIITYAVTYQRKSFEEIPFTIVDGLILSQVSYYDYRGSFFERKIFRKRVRDFLQEKSDIILKGMLTTVGDKKLIEVLKQGGRHGDLKACSYVEKFDTQREKQFAAITFSLGGGEYFIAFRGTDCSVVGWKEDFAMSFREEVPAQKEAVSYAREVMRRFPGRFYIGGHSKGGNLAVYAAMCLEEDLQSRIQAVYNFDGPGFLKRVYEHSGYALIRPKLQKLVPQSAVIGMMLEEDFIYQVIHSNADALRQHDPYTWQVVDRDFRRRDKVDILAVIVKRTLDGWLSEMPLLEREKIVNTVFDVLYKTNINWFYEITDQLFEKVRALLNSASDMDSEERRLVFDAVKRLLAIAAEELHTAAREEPVQQLRELVRLERTVSQLESRALQAEKFLQSIQKGEWNKDKDTSL